MGDVVLIYRSHLPWDGVSAQVAEPVSLCKSRFVRFRLARLAADAADLRRVEFYWCDVGAVSDEDLARVRQRAAREDHIHACLRRLRRSAEDLE